MNGGLLGPRLTFGPPGQGLEGACLPPMMSEGPPRNADSSAAERGGA